LGEGTGEDVPTVDFVKPVRSADFVKRVRSADLVKRVRSALATPADGALATRFTGPLVTALVADASEEPRRLALVLAELIRALDHIGVPRARQFVLLGGDPPASDAAAIALALREALGVPVFVNAPERAGFVAGRLADGTPVELDDELREAEAIVTVGAWGIGADGPRGGAALLCPGVASAATRAAYAAARARGAGPAWAFARAAEREAPVDLSLAWDDAGRVVAASGRSAFATHAREAGLP
jgi:hypothetical protein